MRWPRPLSFAISLAAHSASTASSVAIRGAGPEFLQDYASKDVFACLDGSAKLPFKVVNDNFCDCADGSDEPGTSACAGKDSTLFYCANEGSTARKVYASSVDDGICDCCDGTDEVGMTAKRQAAGLGAACPNTCQEEGERERQEREKKLVQLQEGIAKRKEIQAKAAEDRRLWTEELDALTKALPVLEEDLELARKKSEEQAKQDADGTAATAAPVAGKCGEISEVCADVSALRALVERQQEQIERQQEQITQLLRRVDLISSSARSVSDGVAPDFASAEAHTEARPNDETVEEEKPVVSEYAKWMENAENAEKSPGADEVEDSLRAGIEADDEEMDEEELDASASASKAPLSTDPFVAEKERLVNSNVERTEKLRQQLDEVDSDHMGYASLMNECLMKHDGTYRYKLCFFKDAKQDHVSLGSWAGWTGRKTAKFDNGEMCWGGPARDLKVNFECGEAQLFSIVEPSRCSYEAFAAHPGACDEADAAALTTPPVRHPRDEEL